jgi:hypothetical protein
MQNRNGGRVTVFRPTLLSLPGAALGFFFGGGGLVFLSLAVYDVVRYRQYGNFASFLGMAALAACCLAYFRFGYSVVFDDKVIVHGNWQRKSKKTVDRGQVAAVTWATAGRFTFGQLLDEKGTVLTSFDPTFPRKRVMQVAEFLAVPFK